MDRGFDKPLPRCAGEDKLSGPQACPPPLAGEVAAKLTEGGSGRGDLEGAPSTMLRMVPLPRCAGEEKLSGPQACPPPLAGEVARVARRRGDLSFAHKF
jgi:hypothetical protein